ncbi:hypothetical protein ZWY2020_028489 [Hordeum vulgare]|nr:hypothetical protein ZWY2020_028489 [Hordeum vulgare]
MEVRGAVQGISRRRKAEVQRAGQAVGELPPPHRYVEGGGEEGRRRRHRAGTKEIYARLSRPVSFDDGTKEFWLEKSKGRVCMALSSKALVITAIDDRRYWTHMPTTESTQAQSFQAPWLCFLSKIYARLSRPVSFDDGTKEFWLEKSKGRVCMALSSKALVITAIDDRRYWAFMPTT